MVFYKNKYNTIGMNSAGVMSSWRWRLLLSSLRSTIVNNSEMVLKKWIKNSLTN